MYWLESNRRKSRNCVHLRAKTWELSKRKEEVWGVIPDLNQWWGFSMVKSHDLFSHCYWLLFNLHNYENFAGIDLVWQEILKKSGLFQNVEWQCETERHDTSDVFVSNILFCFVLFLTREGHAMREWVINRQNIFRLTWVTILNL